VRNRGNASAGAPLGIVEQVVHMGQNLVGALRTAKIDNPLAADADGTDLCVDIAQYLARQADVALDDLEQGRVWPPGIAELERRHEPAFPVKLGGIAWH